MKVSSLADLKSIRRELKDRAARAEAQRQEQERERIRLEREQRLFHHAVGPVQPLRAAPRFHGTPALPQPRPLQKELDEQAVMREALSDEFDVETLLLTDEHLSYMRPGMGPDVLRKLRQGDWSIQKQIDLHGMRTDQAREALGKFIHDAHQQGLRCVRVVHGKGLGSPGKTPVLKTRALRWLVQKKEVLAFVQARPADGGAGALVVLLAPHLATRPGHHRHPA